MALKSSKRTKMLEVGNNIISTSKKGCNV